LRFCRRDCIPPKKDVPRFHFPLQSVESTEARAIRAMFRLEILRYASAKFKVPPVPCRAPPSMLAALHFDLKS
jgi:hypothetical protein